MNSIKIQLSNIFSDEDEDPLTLTALLKLSSGDFVTLNNKKNYWLTFDTKLLILSGKTYPEDLDVVNSTYIASTYNISIYAYDTCGDYASSSFNLTVENHAPHTTTNSFKK